MKTDGDGPTENAELREANANLEAISGRAIQERDALREQVGKARLLLDALNELSEKGVATYTSVGDKAKLTMNAVDDRLWVEVLRHAMKLSTALESSEIVDAVKKSEADIAAGRVTTLEDAFAEVLESPSPSSCPKCVELEARCNALEHEYAAQIRYKSFHIIGRIILRELGMTMDEATSVAENAIPWGKEVRGRIASIQEKLEESRARYKGTEEALAAIPQYKIDYLYSIAYKVPNGAWCLKADIAKALSCTAVTTIPASPERSDTPSPAKTLEINITKEWITAHADGFEAPTTRPCDRCEKPTTNHGDQAAGIILCDECCPPAKEKVAARCCWCGEEGKFINWFGLCAHCEKISPEVPEDADATPALPAEVHPIEPRKVGDKAPEDIIKGLQRYRRDSFFERMEKDSSGNWVLFSEIVEAFSPPPSTPSVEGGEVK